MARAYDVAVSALALGVERKWLDNLISQHRVPGTEHMARGVARRLALRALVTAAIVRDLNQGLGVSVARAVELAAEVLPGPAGDGRTDAGTGVGRLQPSDGVPAPAVVAIGDSLTLTIDRGAIEREIEHRLILVMETAVPKRRGRPARKERRGTR